MKICHWDISLFGKLFKRRTSGNILNFMHRGINRYTSLSSLQGTIFHTKIVQNIFPIYGRFDNLLSSKATL